MAYYQRQGLLLVVFKKNRACSLLFKRTTAWPIISSSARVASLASSLLSTLRKPCIRPHRCAILQFMQSMGKKVAAMYCCSQLCITSRENIVCVILIKKIIILLIRTYCLIENVTFTCYSLCS